MERFVAGTSKVIVAEFGVDNWTNKPFIFVAFYDNEISGLDGFETMEEMKAYIKSEEIPNVEYF